MGARLDGKVALVSGGATGMGGGDCGYPFERGKDYVVYARGKEGALVAGICSLTGLATNSRSGLAILRNGMLSAFGTSTEIYERFFKPPEISQAAVTSEAHN